MGDLGGDFFDPPHGFQVGALGWQDEGGISGVHPGILNVLGDGRRHHGTALGHRVHFQFLGIFDKFAHDDGVLLGDLDGPSQKFDQFRSVRCHTHGRATEDVGGPDEDGIAHGLRERFGFLQGH